MARAAPGWRYRAGIAARLAAAVGGGYLIAAMVAITVAWSLPMAPLDAATLGTIAAFLAMPVAAMACFSARSAARAWAGTLAALVLLAVAAMAGGWRP